MPYIFGKLWHLAIIWAIRKAFQYILQGVRILLAKYTRFSPTSDNESYLKVWPGKYLLFKSLILGNIENALIFIGFKKGCVFNQSRLGLADWKWPIKSNSAPWSSARTITCFRADFYIALSHHIDTRHWKRLQFESILENVGYSHTWLGIGYCLAHYLQKTADIQNTLKYLEIPRNTRNCPRVIKISENILVSSCIAAFLLLPTWLRGTLCKIPQAFWTFTLKPFEHLLFALSASSYHILLVIFSPSAIIALISQTRWSLPFVKGSLLCVENKEIWHSIY